MAKKQATDEDPKGFAMRHTSLKEDYQELQRENRALKKRIQRAKVKRDSLLGVVRFLRRRSKILKGLAFEEPGKKAMAHEGGMDASLADKRCGLTTKVTSMDKLLASDQSTSLEPSSTPESHDTPEISGRKHFVTRDIDTFSEPQSTEVTTVVDSFNKKPLLESSELVNALRSSKSSDSPNGLIRSKASRKRKIV